MAKKDLEKSFWKSLIKIFMSKEQKVNKRKKQMVSIIGVRGYPSDVSGKSGVEVYVENIVRELIKAKPFLRLLLYTKSKYQKDKIYSKRILLRRVYTIESKVFETIIYGFLSSFFSIFDKSHTVWYQGIGVATFAFLPSLFGKKIVVTIHGFDWERKKWSVTERVFFRRMAKFVFAKRYAFISVSKKMQKELKDIFGLDSQCLTPGLPTKIRPHNASKYLGDYGLEKRGYWLHVGRLVPEKRVEWLIEAFPKIMERGGAKRLVIVGMHGNLPEYEKELKRRYRNGPIVWTGYVPEEAKQALLANCMCFVLTSEVEGGSPISLLEALSFANYCIVPTISVDKSFSSLGNVFFFEGKSKVSFENVMVKTISALSKKARYQYTAKEKSFLRKSSWKDSALKYQDIFYG